MKDTQITIELFNQCKGTCTGCMLTLEERNATNPVMSTHLFGKVLDELHEYGKIIEDDFRPIMSFGDFPAMDPMFQNEFLEKLDQKSSKFGITLTLVDTKKEKQYWDSIDNVLSIDSSAIFDYTVDPFRLKHNKAYKEVMREAVTRTPHFHMQVLLSEAVLQRLSPEELSEILVDTFGEGIKVNLGFTPSLSNIEKKNYGYDVLSASDYYRRFLKTNITLNEHKAKEIKRYNATGDFKDFMSHGFHISGNADVYPVVHTVYGDIILNPKNQGQSLGRLVNTSLEEIFLGENKQIEKLNRYNNVFMETQDFDCYNCEFYESCKFSGIGLIRKTYKYYENRTGSCYGPIDLKH